METITHNEKARGHNPHVLETPNFLLILWGVIMAASFTIFVMGCWLAHGAYLDEMGLGIAISLITMIVVPYIVGSEMVAPPRRVNDLIAAVAIPLTRAYNIIAVLVIEAVMIILWLATWAAIAAKRAKFTAHVTVDHCYNDGSTFSSEHCEYTRDLSKRGVVFFKTGLAVFAAMAGLGALVWLLFIALFVVTLMLFLRARKDGRFISNLNGGARTDPENHQMTGITQQQQPEGKHAQVQYPQGQYPQGQYPQGGQPQGQYSQDPTQQQYQGYPQQYQQPQGQYQYPQGQPDAQYQEPQQGHYIVSDTSYSAMQPGSELAGSEQKPYASPSASPPPQQYHQ